MKKIMLIALFVATTMVGCVSSKKYKASVAEQNRLKKDSTNFVKKNNELNEKIKGLNQNVEGLNDQINNLRSQLANLEKQNANLDKELDEERKRGQQTKNQLTKQLQELQEVIDKQNKIVSNLRNTIANALVNFNADELSIEIKNGKVYVSLSEQLLFKSGSDKIDKKGQDAIAKLGKVLNQNPDIEVMVEGHTDNVPMTGGKFQDNWELSASRALSIVRILTKEGVEAKRVTGAGRGEFVPVASNETKEGKAKNRRTEIILSPKLDELLKLL